MSFLNFGRLRERRTSVGRLLKCCVALEAYVLSGKEKSMKLVECNRRMYLEFCLTSNFIEVG